jgi:YD repeat-containing protein
LAKWLLYTRRTEFYRPGALPLELSRVVRVADSSSRAFGIGANHSLNIWPIGDQWPFSWIDLILEDGGRLHYRRANWGASYWDAIYGVEYTITDFYDSALSWNGKGWTLSRQDGRTYLFPDGSLIQRAEQGALVGVTDRSGDFLKFQRERSGDLTRVSSNSGPWLQLQYDSQHRITSAEDDSGRVIRYLYNDAGCLQEVADSEHITHYTYDKAKRLSGIEIDGQRVLTAEFQNSDRITGLSLAGVGDYRFAYTVKPSGEAKSVNITQPDSSVMRLDLTGSGYTLQKLSDKPQVSGAH